MSQVVFSIPKKAEKKIDDLKKVGEFLANNADYLDEIVEEIGLKNAISDNEKSAENYQDISVLKKEYADFVS